MGLLSRYSERAVELAPSNARYLLNHAVSLAEHDRFPEAITILQRVLAINPDADDARTLLIFYRRMICDLPHEAEGTSNVVEMLSRHFHAGFSSRHPSPETSLSPIQALVFDLPPHLVTLPARSRALALEKAAPPNPHPLPPPQRHLISYMFSDWDDSPVSDDMQAVFAAHRRHGVGVTLYDVSRTGGLTNSGARSDTLPLRSLGASNAARTLHNVSVLVDLNGFTHGHWAEMLAHRPAAVRIHLKGFPGTMGGFVDYIAGDRVATPVEFVHLFREKIIVCPRSYHVNGHAFRDPHPPEPIALDKLAFEQHGRFDKFPPNNFTFGAFHRPVKIDSRSFHLWLDVLRRAPGSLLWLLRFDAAAETHLKQAAAAAGVDTDRLFFTNPVPLEDHIRVKAAASLFLDSLSYNAHGTAADVLWGGTMVATRPGVTMPTRVASSLNIAHGASAFVTRTDQELLDIAVRVATVKTARDAFEKLRKRINARRTASLKHRLSPIFDADSWTEEFERGAAMALEVMHGQLSMHIVIAQPRAGQQP